jgi:hypothetical protein
MATANLYEASHQWATRPDDERFESLPLMLEATRKHADSAINSHVNVKDLRVVAGAYDLALTGKAGKEARLTHYAFGQLSRLAGAPANYLRELPTSLAAECLNTGIQARKEDSQLNLLIHKNGSLVTRAITSESYDRVWNYQVVEQVQKRLTTTGWRTPPARPSSVSAKGVRKATQEDLMTRGGDFGLSVKLGDLIAPAGLYASDHDCFIFVVNENDIVDDVGKLLSRGAFIQNSEVGDCALKFTTFLYDFVCGNHIVWGAKQVNRVSVRHMKSAQVDSGNTLFNAVGQWRQTLRQLPSGQDLSTQIKQARAKVLGATEEDVIDAAYTWGKGRNIFKLTRSTLTAAYDAAAAQTRYGSPRTVWGLVNGLTEVSQTSAYADERNDLDLQAGRLMEMAF